MENERRLYYKLVKRLHNRRITLFRYEDDGDYALELVNCFSKQDAAEHTEERKAADLPDNLVRGRLLVTKMSLSAEAVRAISELYQAHEKFAEDRQQLRRKRQQIAVMRATADKNTT
ncbi:MAG: hypothetical protein ACRYFX_08925 [Janthinobacterium lividum]